MVAVIAFLGLLVGIDGLLQGQWLRPAAGRAWFAGGAAVYTAIARLRS